jgi:hypothetical protein
MHLKLSFLDWLTLFDNPETRVRLTTLDGYVYEGKRTKGLEFDMELVGITINIQ